MKSLTFIPPRPRIESCSSTFNKSDIDQTREQGIEQEWSDCIKNIDYNEIYCCSSRQSGSQTLDCSNEQVDVVEFFKRNSYTDCIYGEEIAALLKEYSQVERVVTQKSRIIDRLCLIKKHLS